MARTHRAGTGEISSICWSRCVATITLLDQDTPHLSHQSTRRLASVGIISHPPPSPAEQRARRRDQDSMEYIVEKVDFLQRATGKRVRVHRTFVRVDVRVVDRLNWWG